MKKFYVVMLMCGFVFAFFGTLYAGYTDNAKAMVRYMIPWFIWEMFFAVMWVNEDVRKD